MRFLTARHLGSGPEVDELSSSVLFSTIAGIRQRAAQGPERLLRYVRNVMRTRIEQCIEERKLHHSVGSIGAKRVMTSLGFIAFLQNDMRFGFAGAKREIAPVLHGYGYGVCETSGSNPELQSVLPDPGRVTACRCRTGSRCCLVLWLCRSPQMNSPAISACRTMRPLTRDPVRFTTTEISPFG